MTVKCKRCLAEDIDSIAAEETSDWAIALCGEHLSVFRKLGGGNKMAIKPSEFPLDKPTKSKRYKKWNENLSVFCSVDYAHGVNDSSTNDWPEPVCSDCLMAAAQRPPRAVLDFKDGTRTMRNNFIAAKTYRDVEEDGDDIFVRWFEFVKEQRVNDKLVMQFYSEIDSPVDSRGRSIKKEAQVKSREAEPIEWPPIIAAMLLGLAVVGIALTFFMAFR